MDNGFTVITPQMFGAVADGIADDTEAIRKAMEEADKSTGVVYFPAGTYATDVLCPPSNMCLKAENTWSYQRNGRTVLVPVKEDQECIFEVSETNGVTITGLCLEGREMGKNMHGISMCRENHKTIIEHSFRLDNCKITHFTGNGYNCSGGWAVHIRGCMFQANGNYGVYFDSCDGFVIDNIFSSNQIGFGCDTWNSAVNFTENRVEWNRKCGLMLAGTMRYNITANYIDRSFGPAIIITDAQNFHKRLKKTHTVIPMGITIAGNTIVRSGKAAEYQSDDDCHIFMKNAAGVTISANTFNVWKDDGRNGRISPTYGIILESCAHCVISDNAMLPGAVEQAILDRGGHGEQVIISDNACGVVPESARTCQDPFTPVHFMSEGGAPWYADKLKGEHND